jgi:phenylacetate-CoA ligase
MGIFDIARGAYVRSPVAMRRSLAPLLAMVPTSLKYGRAYRHWRQTIARAAADDRFAHQSHLEALRALVGKAHRHSPFYRDLIEKAFGPGFDPAGFTPADLQRLPVLSKEIIAAAGDDMLAAPKARLDAAYTSGSNGEKPFAFYLDKDRSVREIAFVHQAWSRAGYREGDVKAVLRGFRLPALHGQVHEWEPALRELRLSVFPMTIDDASLYLDLIDKQEIRFLYGYPSAIEVFCRHMCRLGRRPKLPFLGILPISEPLYGHQRRLFRTILGDVPIAPFYGLSEKALFAAEVPGAPDIYEFEPLYGVAELIGDDGQPVTEIGGEGRLVGTGFLSTGMPFIRYDSQDRARLVQPASESNGQRLRVAAIMPRRKPDFLIGSDGSRIVTIDFTPEDPVFFQGVAEYQFYQDTPGLCVIKYLASDDGSSNDIERIRTGLSERIEGKITFAVERVESLAAPGSGKRAFIDQRLDIANY